MNKQQQLEKAKHVLFTAWHLRLIDTDQLRKAIEELTTCRSE